MLDSQIRTSEWTFRDVSEEMWGFLRVPFDDGFELMQDKMEIDSDFRSSHESCLKNDFPFSIISVSLKPVLRRVLDTFLGEEQWRPIWRHDTELGHDKALSVQEARRVAELACEDDMIPLIVFTFIGDGVSDLPVPFARRGLRLEEYCHENGIDYVPFDTFADTQRTLVVIADEDQRRTAGRGVSSQIAVPRYVDMSPSREQRIFLWPEAFFELKIPAIEQSAQIAMPAAS